MWIKKVPTAHIYVYITSYRVSCRIMHVCVHTRNQLWRQTTSFLFMNKTKRKRSQTRETKHRTYVYAWQYDIKRFKCLHEFYFYTEYAFVFGSFKKKRYFVVVVAFGPFLSWFIIHMLIILWTKKAAATTATTLSETAQRIHWASCHTLS